MARFSLRAKWAFLRKEADVLLTAGKRTLRATGGPWHLLMCAKLIRHLPW